MAALAYSVNNSINNFNTYITAIMICFYNCILNNANVLLHVFSTITNIILLFGHLALTIIEAIILHQHRDADGICGPSIWDCILMCCILHFMLFIVHANDTSNPNIVGLKLGSITHLISIPPFVWCLVCQFNTSYDCKAAFILNHYPLWILILVEIVNFIVVSVMLLFCVFLMFIMVADQTHTKYTHDRKQSLESAQSQQTQPIKGSQQSQSSSQQADV